MKILDHGYIELEEHMGSDLAIVNNARQSFGKRSDEMSEKDQGLINFLARERHGTPFERVVFAFNVKCPIFVAREWMRHRVGSFNEYSGRYSKMLPEYYVPNLENIRTQVGKPGAYTYTTIPYHAATIAAGAINASSDKAWLKYEELMNMGAAKEIARTVLPVNFYTMFTWVVNLRSLMNFISLRSDDNAMWEIRQYSLAIEELIKPVVPVAYNAFVKNGRVAP